ncbi:hypothetical protein [Microbacterium sp. 22242]|uniref:hypothetical protein n=1 Tax=Microbacterium sp. 22242 TaxID=3453896 RepID=UPI003F851F43
MTGTQGVQMKNSASTKKIVTRVAATGSGLALCAALVTIPQAANANGYGEAWSDGLGGRTTINVIGSSNYVEWVDVGHGHSAEPWLNYCGRQTKSWGISPDGMNQTAYSYWASDCTPVSFFGATGHYKYFMSGSNVWAQAYHDGAWRSGVPGVTIWR